MSVAATDALPPGRRRLIKVQEYPMATAAAVKEDVAHRFAKDQLKAIIERIERLEEEKKGIADDVKDVYAEAKANGYDTKTMRAIVRLRRMEKNARQEAEALLDTYKAALGLD
jgi:uncharacterized protein (UPF0335 family)